MATWSKQLDLWTGSTQAFGVSTDGTKIYYIQGDSPEDVIEYDPSGPSITTIVDVSALSIIARQLCYFNGGLYLAYQDTSNNKHKVAIYNGTPGSITDVAEIRAQTTVAANPVMVLQQDGSKMVAVSIDHTEGVQSQYTADGSTWQTAAFTTAVVNSNSGGPNYSEQNNVPAGRKIVNGFCLVNGGGPGYVCSSGKTFEFTGSIWKPTLGLGDAAYLTSPDVYWTPTLSGGLYNTYTADLVNEQNPAQAAEVCATLNMPFSVGRADSGANTQLYKFVNSNWFTWDTAITGVLFNSNRPSWCVKTADGNVHFLISNGTSGNAEMWLRSETIPDYTDLTHSGSGIPGGILVA